MATIKDKTTIAWGGFNLEVRIPRKKTASYATTLNERKRQQRKEIFDLKIKALELEYPELYAKFSEDGFSVWFESVTGYKWIRKWELDYYKAEFEYEYARSLDKDQKKARRLAQLQYEADNFGQLSSRQRRRIYLALATPLWCDRDKILAIYEKCKIKTLLTGVVHHVDHVIPIQGKLVCGFHIHTNLEVTTAKENLLKTNKFDPWNDS